MSEERQAIIEERNATEQENVILGRMVDNLRAVETHLTNRCGELRAERDRLVAKLEQAEAERNEALVAMPAEHADLVLRAALAERRNELLVAAIQRGYCPELGCRYGRIIESMEGVRISEHSPDCRVAPLLGEK